MTPLVTPSFHRFLRLPAPLAVAALAAALAGAAGCDTAPGTASPVPDLPSITSFFLSPTETTLDSEASTAEIPLTLRIETGGGFGDVTAQYLIRYRATDSLLASGSLPRVGTAGTTFEATPVITLPRGAIGPYEVTVVTEDATGRDGDRAEAVFAFEATSLGPPAITQLDAPATVTRGQAFAVTADVDDPDGLVNVALVEIRAADGFVLARLRDDGSAGTGSGDETAGDGRFTTTLALPDAAEAGKYAFAVVAIDRAGRESDTATLAFTAR